MEEYSETLLHLLRGSSSIFLFTVSCVDYVPFGKFFEVYSIASAVYVDPPGRNCPGHFNHICISVPEFRTFSGWR